MAFIGLFVIMFPFLAAIAGLVVALFAFVGICLVVMGITGIVMNKIYNREVMSKGPEQGNVRNICSILLGLMIIILPICITLYEIIKGVVSVSAG